ncbi:hypothetical protein LTR62_007463 [Meristemomyces frigidus]|uniref:DUF8212 domain-containing protein n=1 Tax=Meristemomyces frigidus TaxID=1508187 RepID=A0AAN7TVA8_9PEZI|nr:hypothetical protein LTR62_007463 [Meristemomyces frigidus]
MSWAARRTATEVEDTAYSLFGLFNVNMPLLYGEREKAFMRLQREIIARSDDESIFAWRHSQGSYGMLAPWPSAFADSGHVATLKIDPAIRLHYHLSNKGLELRVPRNLLDTGQPASLLHQRTLPVSSIPAQHFAQSEPDVNQAVDGDSSRMPGQNSPPERIFSELPTRSRRRSKGRPSSPHGLYATPHGLQWKVREPAPQTVVHTGRDRRKSHQPFNKTRKSYRECPIFVNDLGEKTVYLTCEALSSNRWRDRSIIGIELRSEGHDWVRANCDKWEEGEVAEVPPQSRVAKAKYYLSQPGM